MRTTCLSLCLVLAFSLVAAQDSLIDRCAGQVRDQPEELESYRCYWAASRRGETADAVRALEALLLLDPANHRARLYLAAIKADYGDPAAEALYLDSLEGFRKTGERTGEVYALLSLDYLYRHQGRMDEALEVLDRAVEAAEASTDKVLMARARTSRAAHRIAGADYGLALQDLRLAEDAVLPDGPQDVSCYVLSTIGKAYWNLEMLEEALDSYRREADLWNRSGDLYAESGPRYNIALLSARLWHDGRMEQGPYLQLVRESLESAISSNHRSLEARSRLLLGQADTDRSGGRAEVLKALEIARLAGDRQGAREAMRLLAHRAWREEGDAGIGSALRWVDQAVQDAVQVGNRSEVAAGLIVRAGVLHESGDREPWLAEYEQAIDAVEQIRNLQPEGTVRARAFSRWSLAYYRYAGALLEGLDRSPHPDSDLDRAFRTMERLRSRVLIDEMDGARATPPTEISGTDAVQRSEVLAGIAQVQRQLSSRQLDDLSRQELLHRLRRFEAEEQVLRDKIARGGDRYIKLLAPDIPSLANLQSVLEPDQAVLSFQVSSRKISTRNRFHNGGSWLLIITRDTATAVPLPDKEILKAQTDLFLGLCRRRDGTERHAGERLYDELLAEGLDSLPAEISRLVLLPDDCLHRLPFSALGDRSGRLLGARFQITYAPSATLWVRWNNEPGRIERSSGSKNALVLADPEFGTSAGEGEFREGSPWLEGINLRALPHARVEAKRMVRRLGRGSRLLSGSGASEQSLKDSALNDYVILHFATHAVVDLKQPERSAIVLAPGSSTEDGFLQLREIVDMDLNGQVVILSGCRTVSGAVLEGEGTLSLARAFFQAGARSVVGSLWPLRDDDAGKLMDRFTRNLARGQSVSGALTAARKELIDSGAPASAWAGVVVLGDGDLVPVPGGSARSNVWIPALLAILVVVALAIYRFRPIQG